MPTIRLIPIDAALVAALDESADRFESIYGVRLGDLAEFARDPLHQNVAHLKAHPRHPYFGAYLAADEDTSEVIGTCAYKFGPTADGDIEIAYGSFPPFEGRGYATAMTGVLVLMAEAVPAVRRVLAHTLPEPNASGRVLTKNGFRNVGEVHDPEDGRVWRWEKDISS